MDDGVDDCCLGQMKGVAKEETQGESGRGDADRGVRGVCPNRGPRGMDDGRKI